MLVTLVCRESVEQRVLRECQEIQDLRDLLALRVRLEDTS